MSVFVRVDSAAAACESHCSPGGPRRLLLRALLRDSHFSFDHVWGEHVLLSFVSMLDGGFVARVVATLDH